MNTVFHTAASAAAAAIALLVAQPAVTAQSASYTFVQLGPDCGPASIATTDLPQLGTTFTVEVAPNLAPVDGNFSYLLTGFAALPVPVDIGAVTGHQPCGPIAAFCGFLFLRPDVVEFVRFGVGGGGNPVPMSLTIPNSPTLAGLTFYQQNLTVGSGFGPACVDLSRTGIGVIGV